MSKKNQNKNNEPTKSLVEENVVTDEVTKEEVMETTEEIIDNEDEVIETSEEFIEEVENEEEVTPETVTEEKEEEVIPESITEEKEEEVVVKEKSSPVKENKKCKCKKEMTYSDMFGYMWNGQNF